MHQEDELADWARRLQLADDELQQREQQAVADDPTAAELAALAAERDKIALDRDNIAASYDERATTRDEAALDRDVAAAGRDRRGRGLHDDLDPGFPDRWLGAVDRDDAAGDRADSRDDRARSVERRAHAAADRDRAADARDRAAALAAEQDSEARGLRDALESRLLIGQAQGLLMARHDVSAQKAFAVLVRLAQHSQTTLRDMAARLVAAADAGES